MANPTLAGPSTTLTFQPHQFQVRRIPDSPRQNRLLSSSGLVRVVEISAKDERMIEIQIVQLPLSDEGSFSGFSSLRTLIKTEANWRENTLTLTDTDGDVFVVRFWDSDFALEETRQPNFDGRLRFRVESEGAQLVEVPLTPTYRYSAADLFLNVGIAEGGAVTTWRDMQGTGEDLVSSASNHTLQLEDGQPYVDFPGTQGADVFNVDSGGSLMANNRYVLFVVARMDVASQMTMTSLSVAPSGDIDNYDAFFGHNGASTPRYEFIHKATSATTVTGTQDPGTAWHVFAYRIGADVIASGKDNFEIYIDSDSPDNGDDTISSTLTRTLLVGGRWTDSGTGSILPLDGGIKDVLIYDERDSPARPLDDSELASVMNALVSGHNV